MSDEVPEQYNQGWYDGLKFFLEVIAPDAGTLDVAREVAEEVLESMELDVYGA